MNFFATALLALGIVFAVNVDAKIPRSSAAKHTFRVEHPCPATSHARGPCRGYVVDHISPLCAGGADHPNNMQWQSVVDAKIKDRAERAQCRRR